MANISAKEVQALRERTGVGMMDCKRALVETDGDMEKAVILLREKGIAKADKKASRIAAEGVIAIYQDNGVTVLCEVNAETDFVAKNAKFQAFADNIASVVAKEAPKDVEALMNCKYPGEDLTVEDKRKEMVMVIGENMNVRRFVRLEGNVYTYNHGNGRIGVAVKFDAPADECAKNVCMQVASMNPKYIRESDVPAAVLEQEKEIIKVQIKNDPKNANKPDSIIEKMASGKIGKFFTENCLEDQEYFIDDNMTVWEYIASCTTAKVVEFVRFERGEGMEKREDNFAEEVASMIK